MKRIHYLVLGASALIAFLTIASMGAADSFEDRRIKVIGEMEDVIRDEVEAGNYKCCIDPPCDMCFLGHFIWEDGVCRCDELIAAGRADEVCPQCKRGIEEGRCTSSDKGGSVPCDTA